MNDMLKYIFLWAFAFFALVLVVIIIFIFLKLLFTQEKEDTTGYLGGTPIDIPLDMDRVTLNFKDGGKHIKFACCISPDQLRYFLENYKRDEKPS